MDISAQDKKQDQVRSELEKWLQSVEVGARLLPQRELSTLLGVSRPTIRKAVEELVESGVLARVHGSGIYVNRPLTPVKRTICFVHSANTPATNAPFFVNTYAALESQVRARDGVFLSASLTEGEGVSPSLISADGIILMANVDPALLPSGKPLVVLFVAGYYGVSDASYVLVDDYLGGMTAARHLVSLGHKKMMFTGDMKRHAYSRERYRGACDVAAEAHLPQPGLADIDSTRPVSMDVAEAVAKSGASALMCTNDHVAMSVISALHKMGLGVPEDVSVTGFDDLPSASLFEPPLTTLRLPVADAVSMALDELELKLSSPGQATPRRIILPTELIERGSTRRFEG